MTLIVAKVVCPVCGNALTEYPQGWDGILVHDGAGNDVPHGPKNNIVLGSINASHHRVRSRLGIDVPSTRVISEVGMVDTGLHIVPYVLTKFNIFWGIECVVPTHMKECAMT
jgi:hypothetical protein